MTQGETREDLEDKLKDIYKDIIGDLSPAIKKVAELEIT